MAKLVAIGDSLTQGFHSLAITNTEQSFPALLARSLGATPETFLTPDFRGRGGLPCSLEWLARRLEQRFGADLSAFEWIRAVHAIPDLLDEVEDYWERGRGSRPVADLRYHNLAVWGFEVADAYQISAGFCRERIGRPTEGVLAIPSEARLRTALRVLNPGHTEARWNETQVSAARAIKERDGTIDHLIVWLGANNCLGTVVDLRIDSTGDMPVGPCSGKTLWTERAFEADYAKLCDQIQAIGAKHVYLATVPHVTIPPITRGIMTDRGRLPEGEQYFDYYTRFFIHDKNFESDRDPHLTKAQAMHIDATIDAYNRVIRRNVQDRGFELVDMCDVLDRLAVRRNHNRPTYPLPPALADLTVRFFEIGAGSQLRSGGLIGLDGVHPTATGYALVAHEFLQKIRPYEPDARPIDFAEARRWDALVSRPPRTLNDMLGALETLERFFHFSKWMSLSKV